MPLVVAIPALVAISAAQCELSVCLLKDWEVIPQKKCAYKEHVIFCCPEYNTCRLKYPELFNLSDNNIKELLNIDDQESISKFLWDIRNIRVYSGSEC